MNLVKVKTINLVGEALNWVCAIADGAEPVIQDGKVFVPGDEHPVRFDPAGDWAHCWPLLNRHKITVGATESNERFAVTESGEEVHGRDRRTAGCLAVSMSAKGAAAMALSMSGEEVQIPEEFLV